jgi:hypothetical protein
MWLILAVLLLALPVAWWGWRTLPEESSAPRTAQASVLPGSSHASPTPRPSGTFDGVAEEPEDSEAPSDEDFEEEFLENQLAGPGPCIELEVTARGAPVPNAEVSAVRLESEEDISFELSPIPVGPEGRRQAWCQPGEYRLAAIAPGFAASIVKLAVKQGGSKPVARFELNSGHSLSGRVLDKDTEQPLPGAQLSVSFQDDDFTTLMSEVPVISDGQGNFRLDLLAPGTYQVDARAPGHTLTSVEVAVPRQQPLSIELEGTSRLEGQVVDGTGAPVPRAKVWVGPGHLSEDSTEQTDAQGSFSLEVNEGTYVITASAAGQSGVHDGKVTVARGGLVDGLIIRLRPTGSLAGRAFMQSSQEPVDSAFMTLSHGELGMTHTAKTKADGTFLVENLLPGRYTLSLYKGEFAAARKEDLNVQPGQQTSVEFALVREAALEGTVTDVLGRPAEDAMIVAVLTEDLKSQSQHREQHGAPDKSGHYEISSLPPGRYRVEAKLTWQSEPVTRELTLQEGETGHADFVLTEALGIVEGTVRRASGGPPVHPVGIEAVSSEINDQTAEVDEKGHFTLKLRPNEYVFRASYNDALEEGPEQTVRVEAGKIARVALTVPDALAETSGVVLNARGEPVSEAGVSLDDGDELTSNAETDEQGRFTLRTAMSTLGKTVLLEANNGPEEGSLRNVRVGSKNVVLRLQKAAGLRGRLVTVRGPPVQGFELRVFQLSEDGSMERQGTKPFVADTFEWVDLPSGTFELQARTSDGRTGKVKVQIAPGQTATTELPVGVLASVKGQLTQTAGPPTSRWVAVDSDTPGEQMAYPLADGRFELIALEPGKHLLSIGPWRKIPVELREGETLDVGTQDLSPAPAPAPKPP